MTIEVDYNERRVDLEILAAQAREARIKRARAGNIHCFAELVMINEETGGPIEMAPLHLEWHDLVEKHDRLHIFAHVESGKTQQMAVCRTLFDLGLNPNLRYAICSNTKGQAKKTANSIKKYLEESKVLKQIFPHLVPGQPWTDSAFSVQRETFAKDPSVQCTGVHGNILGSRLDRLVLDDILDYENTRTSHARNDLKHWVKATLMGRLTKFAKVRSIGTAWHPDDLLHEYARMSAWCSKRYSVFLPDGSPRWPASWPPERIADKREELGPIEFARQMECLSRDDSTSIFKREYLETCLALGDGRSMADALSVIPRGYRVITGVDLAVSKKDSADLTCFFTIAVDPFGSRHVLEIDSGRWSGPEIINKIKSVYRRFNSIIWVENNAAQDYILQFTRDSSAVPVMAHTTGRNKMDPQHGLQSLAVELYNGKWVIPSAADGTELHPEVAEFVDEMLFYDPNGHTGDRLMAAWIAREGLRQNDSKKRGGNVRKPNLQRR